ncbi:MAG TPA: prolyl oligopeptidase family serine peptidase [Terracidiphilus sp.]|nr:prolyl oligopeptidase family serine peptidase [Terracidiphilus sp.]
MRRTIACALLGALSGAIATSQTIRSRGGFTLPPPPDVQPVPVTDNYFGTKIVDNYRWLENADSPETKDFIDQENAYTQRYMEQARIRPQISDDMDALEHVSEWKIPIQRGNDLFFEKMLAGENQSSIYMRHGWAEKDKRLIDPAQFSRDPDTSVGLDDVSRDATLVAYDVRQGGADESTVRVFNVKTGKTLLDELPSGIYLSVVFTPDGKGLYYSRMDRKGTLIYEHQFGQKVSHDAMIFGKEFRGEELGTNDLMEASLSDDYRYLVIQIDRGVPPKRVDIVYRDLTKPGSYFDVLIWGVDSRFSADYVRGTWFVSTDYKSPNWRIMKADPGVMPDAWTTVVPEGSDAIDGFNIVGDKIYVNRLHDAQLETSVYGLDGKPEGSVLHDGIGKTTILAGRSTDRFGLYSFESFITPLTIYRLDTVTGKQEIFAQPKVPFDSSQYKLKQVFYTSKDGTKIPMFIAGKKGLKQDGTERLLMTAYGGFNLSELPEWRPAYAWWLEAGGWFAVPSLRGGGEYGQRWHEQGMFEKKQNVFDDFYAAAEYLIANKYTSPEHFAIMGRSNGGLLMGAAITQRPDLFSAVECGYPLLDMLRYQKFEQGPHWMTEYGSADNEKQFPYLLKYSPYQNVKKSSAYPAVLFFTGASDTRVDPLHARKMTALLQADSTSGRPVLLHYSTSGGHSAGVGVEQEIQDVTDQMTFLWTETGQTALKK